MVAIWCVTLTLVTTWATMPANDGAAPFPSSNGEAPVAVDDPSPRPTSSTGSSSTGSSGADPSTTVSSSEPETLEAAVLDLLTHGRAPARIAVLSVVDADRARAARLGAAIARALVAERIEVVTEKSLAETALPDDDDGRVAALAPLAVDHVLFAEVKDEGGVLALDLRLVASDGAQVARSSVTLTEADPALVKTRQSVRGGVLALVDGVAVAMEQLPGETRYQRLAVLPLATSALTDENKGLTRAVERELSRALVERGFLVVERTRLDAVLEAREADVEDSALPELARALDAQAFVAGSVAPAGDMLVVSVRVISSTDGRILGTGSAEIPREGTIALTSDLLETRTPSEALFRSAVAPGWGQFYNQEPVKGGLVAIAVFGLAATTVILGGAGALTRLSYELAAPLPGDDPAQLGASLKARREAADVMLLTAVATGVLTTLLWSGNVVDAYLTAGE